MQEKQHAGLVWKLSPANRGSELGIGNFVDEQIIRPGEPGGSYSEGDCHDGSAK
jgi:hypothetical protein